MPNERSNDQEMPCFVFTGHRIALGPLRGDLVPVYHRWSNDLDVSRFGRSQTPTTQEQDAAAVAIAANAADEAHFTVYDHDLQRPIGRCRLTEIDYRHRTAQVDAVIGDKEYLDQDFQAEAIHLTLDFAFTVLGLHNVGARVYEFDTATRRAMTQAGLRECGRRRQAHRLSGRLWDVILLECLSSEFTASVLKPLVEADE